MHRQTLGISEKFFSTFNLYPYLISNIFTLDLASEHQNISVQITNLFGRTIVSQDFGITRSIKLKIEKTEGIYFVSVTISEGRLATKKQLKSNL